MKKTKKQHTILVTSSTDYQNIEQRIAFTPEKKSLSIGRDAACDITLDNEEVSANHAILSQRGEHVHLKDAGSLNGIILHGERMFGSKELIPGDIAQIGPYYLALDRFEKEEKPKKEHPPKRKQLLLLMPLLLIMVVLAGWVVFKKQPHRAKKVKKLTQAQREAQKEMLGIEVEIKQDHDGLEKILTGENELMNNELSQALQSFSEAMTNAPDALRANQYIKIIKARFLPQLYQSGMEAIQKNNQYEAKKILQQMEKLSADGEQTRQIKQWLQAEEKFTAAKKYYQQQQYQQAYTLLTNLTLLNNAKTAFWIQATEEQLNIQHEIVRGVDLLQKKSLDKALVLFGALRNTEHLSEQQLQRVERILSMTKQLVLFYTYRQEEKDFETVVEGERLTNQIDKKQFPKIYQQLIDELDALRTHLADQQEQYKTSYDYYQYFATVHENDPFMKMTNLNRVLQYLVLLNFLQNDEQRSIEIAALQSDLEKYAKSEYQQAYILESMGLFEEAAMRYQQCADVARDESRYAEMAQKKVETFKSYLEKKIGNTP